MRSAGGCVAKYRQRLDLAPALPWLTPRNRLAGEKAANFEDNTMYSTINH